MYIYFQTAIKMKNVLFEGLDTNNIRDMVILTLVSFVVTVMCSALASAKDIVAARRRKNPLARSQEDESTSNFSMEGSGSQSELLSSLRIPTNVGVVRRHKFQLFALESLIHTVKFAYGYMLMLLVMTYSAWLTIAVVLGSGLGYFLFQPFSLHITSMYSQPPSPRPHLCCDNDNSGEVRDDVSMPPPTSVINTGQTESLISSVNHSGRGEPFI